jgi:hypothetical protein
VEKEESGKDLVEKVNFRPLARKSIFPESPVIDESTTVAVIGFRGLFASPFGTDNGAFNVLASVGTKPVAVLIMELVSRLASSIRMKLLSEVKIIFSLSNAGNASDSTDVVVLLDGSLFGLFCIFTMADKSSLCDFSHFISDSLLGGDLFESIRRRGVSVLSISALLEKSEERPAIMTIQKAAKADLQYSRIISSS